LDGSYQSVSAAAGGIAKEARMTQDEKDKLLRLFAVTGQWCREAEARDGTGEPVRYNDPTATSWDLVGGLCHLFGWQRACRLFVQLGRHLLGTTARMANAEDEAMSSMSALIDFNDDEATTHELLLERLRDIPVRPERPEGAAIFS